MMNINLSRTNAVVTGASEGTGKVLYLLLQKKAPMWAFVTLKHKNPDFCNMALQSTPTERLGMSDETGKVAAFIVSPPASWITGAFLSVDGG